MLFTAAILGIFVYGIIAAMLGTILPDLSKKYSLTPKQNGNIALIQALGLMIGSFCSGPLMDIYGKQVGMLLGLGLVAVALLALAASIVAPYPKASGQVSFNFVLAASLLTNPKVLLPALLLFLYTACEVGVWNWLVRHLMAQGVPEKRAMTILSLGFALGLIVGRVGISRVLLSVDPRTVLIGASIAMAVTTFLMLQSSHPTVAWVTAFIAGLAMAPVFPTTLGVVGKAFMQTPERIAQGLPAQEATALGIAVTAAWFGIVVSSPIIGGIAGDDPKKLKKALLLLPAASILMAGVAYAM